MQLVWPEEAFTLSAQDPAAQPPAEPRHAARGGPSASPSSPAPSTAAAAAASCPRSALPPGASAALGLQPLGRSVVDELAARGADWLLTRRLRDISLYHPEQTLDVEVCARAGLGVGGWEWLEARRGRPDGGSLGVLPLRPCGSWASLSLATPPLGPVPLRPASRRQVLAYTAFLADSQEANMSLQASLGESGTRCAAPRGLHDVGHSPPAWLTPARARVPCGFRLRV
jgi:hypothetical protein